MINSNNLELIFNLKRIQTYSRISKIVELVVIFCGFRNILRQFTVIGFGEQTNKHKTRGRAGDVGVREGKREGWGGGGGRVVGKVRGRECT